MMNSRAVLARRIFMLLLSTVLGIAGAVALLRWATPAAARGLYNSKGAMALATSQTVRDLIATPGIVLSGEAISHEFGSALAGAGDVNSDGYDDLVVGALRYYTYTGRAYVYFGGIQGYTYTAAITLTGETEDNFFGRTVALADIDGDEYSDVIIGAYGYLSYTGKVYIYSGSETVILTPNLTLTGSILGEGFGRDVAQAGDVNDDGFEDLLVGAPHYSSDRGRVYVYMGSQSGLAVTPALTLIGQAAGDWFGIDVATAGDVNGDTFADVAVGAPRYGSETGRVYVYYGSQDGLGTTPAVTLTGEAAGVLFGTSVATAGDVNDDGYDDLIVGASEYNFGTGRAYLYYGSAAGLSAAPDLVLDGATTNNYFGRSVATAGDANGDGVSDVVIGAYGYFNSTGRVYLYYGNALGLSATPVLTLTGTNMFEYFGHSAIAAGDSDGDGYSDLAVGGLGYANRTGRVYVYNVGQRVRFTSSAYSVSEGAANGVVTLTLLASPTQVTTVTLTTSHGTASSLDYTALTTTVVFSPGVVTRSVNISITEDISDEPDETVIVNLSAPGNTLLGTPNSAMLTIVDNDAAPTVYFSSTAYSVTETTGPAIISATLSAPSGFTVTVNSGSGGGSAQVGADYQPFAGQVTFAPGQVLQTFAVQVLTDDLIEPEESVLLTLGMPVNASLGTPSTAWLYIGNVGGTIRQLFLPLVMR